MGAVYSSQAVKEGEAWERGRNGSGWTTPFRFPAAQRLLRDKKEWQRSLYGENRSVAVSIPCGLQARLFGQIFHEAHAVVAEDDFALLLGGVQVHIGFYAEVAGVLLVQEDLADVPGV